MSAADYYATAMTNYQNCYPVTNPSVGQHYTDFGGHVPQVTFNPSPIVLLFYKLDQVMDTISSKKFGSCVVTQVLILDFEAILV